MTSIRWAGRSPAAPPDRRSAISRLSVSLVIPCYNAAPFLAAALHSAIGQTLPPDEILVIDDGSTDDSAGIAARVDGPIRVLRMPHAGIAAARNAGVQAATGNAVAFLDADDLWTPQSLENRCRRWEQTPSADYVYGSILCFDDRTGAAIGNPEPGRLAGSLLLRRSAFDEIGLFDTSLKTGETIDWIGRADVAGYRCMATEEIVLHRRVHVTNTTRDSDRVHADYLKILRRNLARRT